VLFIMTKNNQYTQMLGNFVDARLGNYGFQKRKLLWNKDADSVVYVIDLQISKWSDCADDEAIRFTMNLGVCIKELYEMVWQEPRGEFVLETDCFPRIRIAELLGVNDKWWHLSSSSDAEIVLDEIGILLEGYVVPFYMKMNSLESILHFSGEICNWKVASDAISWCALNMIAGDQESAISNLESMLASKKYRAWVPKIKNVLEYKK
jgi:Domain of unknown function (DUF4304)